MPYGDEEIIRRRVAAGAKQKHTIKNEVEIDGVKYTFARREFEFGFSMVVPEGFVEMPRDVARQMFPHEDRPRVILCSGDYTVCIAFNCGDMRAEELKSRVSSFRAYLKKLHPSNVFFTQGIYDLENGLRVGYYDYRCPVIDCDLYQLVIDADLPDKELLGWFSCPVELKDKWEPLMRQMAQTIDVIAKEG